MAALELYAPDKGKYSRWALGASAMGLVAYGVHSLYWTLPEGARAPIFGWKPLGDEMPVSLALFLCAVVLAAGAFGTWLAINHHKLVDLLHETEVEMGKVSWASKEEVTRSSIVVVTTTVLLGVWVTLADALLFGVRWVFGG